MGVIIGYQIIPVDLYLIVVESWVKQNVNKSGLNTGMDSKALQSENILIVTL